MLRFSYLLLIVEQLRLPCESHWQCVCSYIKMDIKVHAPRNLGKHACITMATQRKIRTIKLM